MKWIRFLVFAALVCRASDIDALKSEPDPEKRSEHALGFAEKTLASSRELYTSGEYKKAMAGLEPTKQAVDIVRDSLLETHKSAHKSKYFKRAELRLRGLARHAEEFARDCAVDDRPTVESLVTHINQVHDDLLSQILEKKK